MADILHSEDNLHGRVGVRVHPVRHPLFQAELDLLLKHAGDRLAYIMVPKPESLADVQEAVSRVTRTAAGLGLPAAPPVHVLIETHGALRDVFAIAAMAYEVLAGRRPHLAASMDVLARGDALGDARGNAATPPCRRARSGRRR